MLRATAEKRKRRRCKSGQVKYRGSSSKKERRRETRERTKMEQEDSNSNGAERGRSSRNQYPSSHRRTFLRSSSNEPPRTIGLGFSSAVVHDIRYPSLFTAITVTSTFVSATTLAVSTVNALIDLTTLSTVTDGACTECASKSVLTFSLNDSDFKTRRHLQ